MILLSKSQNVKIWWWSHTYYMQNKNHLPNIFKARILVNHFFEQLYFAFGRSCVIAALAFWNLAKNIFMFVIVLTWPLHAICSNEYILDLSKIYIKCQGLLRFSPEILHFWHSALASFQEVVLMQFKHAIFQGLWTPREEIAFTARPKVQSQSQIFRYGGSKFCLPHRPKFPDIFDLCLHWVSVVRVKRHFLLFNYP